MDYKKWECIVCGLIYDESEGWPEDGIEPGTNGKMFLKIGYVQIAVSERKILIWLKYHNA